MRHEHLRAPVRWDEPVARDRHSFDLLRLRPLLFFPMDEIDCTGKRGKHYELRERETGALRKFRGRGKGVLTIRVEPEDERTEDVYVVVGEALQLFDELF